MALGAEFAARLKGVPNKWLQGKLVSAPMHR
jgi:hypothetical protein